MVERFTAEIVSMHNDGAFVSYSNYAALKAENERLERDLARKHEAFCIASDQAMANGSAYHKELARAEAAERALAERAGGVEREPDAYRVHAVPDDYYGTGGDKLQFHPLTSSQIEHGETATPLYSLTTEPAAPEGQQEPVAWVARIGEVLDEGDGFWRSCSGCHELDEGHPTGDYSAAFRAHVGVGCGECGGLGVIWDDTDYSEMGDYLTRPAEQAVTEAMIDKAVVEAINALRVEQPGRAYDILKAAMEAGR